MVKTHFLTDLQNKFVRHNGNGGDSRRDRDERERQKQKQWTDSNGVGLFVTEIDGIDLQRAHVTSAVIG